MITVAMITDHWCVWTVDEKLCKVWFIIREHSTHVSLKKWTLKFKLLYQLNHIGCFNEICRYVVRILTYKIWKSGSNPCLRFLVMTEYVINLLFVFAARYAYTGSQWRWTNHESWMYWQQWQEVLMTRVARNNRDDDFLSWDLLKLLADILTSCLNVNMRVLSCLPFYRTGR